MANFFIGRKEEKEILEAALSSKEAEMIAVIGRRRVGKTYLIESVYEDQIVFQITGLQNATKAEQLDNFAIRLTKLTQSKIPLERPKSWLRAFDILTTYLDEQLGAEKKVVFLDELPWLSTHKSGFLTGLSYFWNSWAVKKNIVLVVCGSAASWMIQKVINNKGGLYNRVTKRIFLSPFTLAETETYFQAKDFDFTRYQITQLYLALGGIPHHLKEVQKGKTAVQNINQICFSQQGLLRTEFSRLYPALFAHADKHIAVIRALATKQKGLTRNEIIKTAKLPNGNSTTRVLEELEYSGFISAYRPFNKKKKNRLYRLTDEYSLFYLKFIEGKAYEGKSVWNHLSQTQAFKTWSGYAFESLCLKHIPQIKKSLDIAGIYSLSSSFYHKGTSTELGTQIDLLIDRNDGAINLFEIKFYADPFIVSKSYADNLRQKRSIFKSITKTKKQIFYVLIAAQGVVENGHSQAVFSQVLGLDDLFVNLQF
ncbi:MAG: AAA family ATPase [Chitinophagales bacterium]